MRASRSSFDLGAIARGFPRENVQFHPAFPDLMNQPDLLISPRPGILVAVFTYFLEKTRALRPGLEAIEDVFETKLVVGETTTIVGIVLNGFPGALSSSRTPQLYPIMKALFDLFIEWPKTQPEALAREFLPAFRTLTANVGTEQLWKSEREIVAKELQRFNSKRYLMLLDRHLQPLTQSSQMLEQGVGSRLRGIFPADIVDRYLPNAPASLASLSPRRTLLRFDFGLSNQELPIEVVRFERGPIRRRIRHLMAKARLLRYSNPASGDYFVRMIRPLLVIVTCPPSLVQG